MNETQLFNFKGQQVRTITINNEPYFVGNDVATILGYSNYRNAVVNHVDKEDKLRTQIEYAGQNRNMTVINESGLYSLILGSKLPTAKEFAEYTEYLDRRKPRLSREWIDLRSEITNYCHSHKTMSRSFSTQQNFIYGAIRFVTGISQIDQLKGSQVDLARMVFHELVEKRENFSNEIN